MNKPKQFFKKNNKVVRLTLPDINTFYKATVTRKYNIGIKIDLYINGRERELRSRPTNLWSTDSQQRYQGNSMWKTIVFQHMMLEELYIHLKRKESQFFAYTIHKI